MAYAKIEKFSYFKFESNIRKCGVHISLFKELVIIQMAGKNKCSYNKVGDKHKRYFDNVL